MQLQSFFGSTNFALLTVCDLMTLHSQLLGSLESFPVDPMTLYSSAWNYLLFFWGFMEKFWYGLDMKAFFQNFSNSAAKS